METKRKIFQIVLTYWFRHQVMFTLYANQLSYTWFEYGTARVWVGSFGPVTPEEKANPENWETITRYHCKSAGAYMFSHIRTA